MPDKTSEAGRKAKKVSVRLVVVLAVFAVILLLFIIITDEIVLENQTGFDNIVFKFLHRYTTSALTAKMIFFTFFGSTGFLLPAYTILALYFLIFKKNNLRSLNIAAIGLSSVALLFLIKEIFKRHRPVDPLLDNVTGFSYPSGHSFSAFTFFGLLIYILWEFKISTSLKWIGTFLLFCFAAMIATSRVYLHVHYASDVAAGFCLSFLWLTICIYMLNKIENRSKFRRSTTVRD